MSTRFVCDWCGAEFDDRAKVASADVTIGQVAEQLHMCVACAPDHLKQEYPQGSDLAADGGTWAQKNCRHNTGTDDSMKRVTLRMPDGLVETIDGAVDRGDFPNRSEAIRTACHSAFVEADGGQEVPLDCPTCGQDYDLYIADFGRYTLSGIRGAHIHFSEHVDRGPEIFVHEHDVEDHRLAGAEPATQPDDAPRDANDDSVFEDIAETDGFNDAHIAKDRAAENARPLTADTNATSDTPSLKQAIQDVDVNAEKLARELAGEQSILEEALDTVGERDDTHGDPVRNHEQIAHLWTDYLRFEITPREVAEMMILVKLSRHQAGSPTRDGHRDIAGYAEIASQCADYGGDD